MPSNRRAGRRPGNPHLPFLLLLVVVLAAACGGGQGLPGKTPDEKAIAAAELGVNGADENIPVLLHAVETEPELVQTSAIVALGRIGTPAAVEALGKLSNHEARRIRLAVAQALQDVLPEAYPEAAKVLVEMGRHCLPKGPGKDPDREIRRAVVTSLAVVQQPVGLDYLVDRLKNDYDENVRNTAVKTLGRLKDPRAVDVLIEVFHTDNTHNQAWAIESLGEIGDPRAIPTVKEALDIDVTYDAIVRGKAAWALMQLAGKDAIPDLEEALAKEPDDMAAVRMAHALAKLGVKEAIPVLEDRLLHAEREFARAEAARALKDVGRKESFEVVDRAFREDRSGLVKKEAGQAAIALIRKYHLEPGKKDAGSGEDSR